MWPFRKKNIIFSKRKYCDYLPVGTIVKLHNDNNEYMIYRYSGNRCMPINCNSKYINKSHVYTKSKDKKNIYYHADYFICEYPFPNFNSIIYIMHEDIKEVVYMGYNDSYRKNILNDIDSWNGGNDING